MSLLTQRNSSNKAQRSLWRSHIRAVRPMLAMLSAPSLEDPQLVYEPKYDGIRALVEIEPGSGSGGVRIWSRLGNEKTAQFPELVRALDRFRRTLKAPVLLDGEIVALDDSGEPAGFQQLQGRIHLSSAVEARGSLAPVVLVVFDVLRDGSEDLRSLPWTVRRARLERIMGAKAGGLLRVSEYVPGNGRDLYTKALDRGWEGLIAKSAQSPYRSGKRTSEWRKLKIVRRQEFVIGGWTEPRNTRSSFGALLLGVHEGQALRYVGHTGSGFTESELSRVEKLLRTIETKHCPFDTRPRTNERPHWIEPKLVAEVKFTEWTSDGKLRHPIYLGLRDDVDAKSVHREAIPPLHQASPPRVTAEDAPLRRSPDHARYFTEQSREMTDLLAQLEKIEAEGGDGVLRLSGGIALKVGNLHKIFWPSLRLTKGALMQYYVRMAPFILPAVKDRPLVMKRFPNGVKAPAFYQQRAPDKVPPSVRVEVLSTDREVPSRLVGGSLATLLHMTQLGVISQDPWFSRVQSPNFADYVALDLDPMPAVPFSRVLDVARWLRDELERYRIPHVPKTSGASGVHIYIPMPAKTTYETGRLLCQILSTIVAKKHPNAATVTRTVNERGRKVYIDYLQNIPGKTLATAYSARASNFAGASAPVTWEEIERGVLPSDFTIVNLPKRVRRIGDLWANLRTSSGVDLHAILDRLPHATTR